MYLIAFLTLFTSFFTYAIELEPIIYASKLDLTAEQVTSSTELIGKDELSRTNDSRIAQKLKTSSSLDVSQTGVSGGQAGVFIRGLEAKHTVFAINGIRIYDAASIQKVLNPSILNSAHVERIEILKGAQSVLYGSDAIGGVVNIITSKEDLVNAVSIEQGIYSSYEIAQNAFIGSTLINFSSFYQEDLNHNDLTVGSEKDKKFNKGASVEVSYGGTKWESVTQLKLINDFSETDGQNFTTDLPIDAKNNHVDTTQFFGTQKIKYSEERDSTYALDLSLQNSNRVNKSENSIFNYNGEVRQAELKYLGKNLLLGTTVLEEIYSDDELSNEKLTNADIFSQLSQSFGKYSIELGARLTSSQFYGGHVVYNVGASQKLSKTQTVSLSQKTGFSAPSSYQLFGKTSFGDVGNEDLTPEKSVSIEVSHQYKAELLSTEVSLFQTKVENHIDFRNNRYENIDGSFYQGIELSLNYSKFKYFGGLSATLIDYDLSSGEEPERRARENFKLTLGKQLSDSSELSLDYRYTGTRFEDINGESKILSAYDVIDLNFSKTSGDFKLNLAVKNMFDKVYEEAYLYATMRFGVQGRVTYSY